MSIKLDQVTYTYGVGSPFERTALHETSVEIRRRIRRHHRPYGVGQVDLRPAAERADSSDEGRRDCRRYGYFEKDEGSHGYPP